jgi:hypothetical protein
MVQGADERRKFALLVTEAYIASTPGGSDLVRSYKALKESNEMLFKQMMSQIDVRFVSDYEDTGYKSANEMIERLKKSGVLLVDVRFSNNPYLNEKENLIFRAVHDFYTHVQRGKKFELSYNFDLKGEYQTYNIHAKLAPRQALPALFSEVVGQVSYEVITGTFPDPQKCTFMRGFDFVNVGMIRFKRGQQLVYGEGVYDDNFQGKTAREYIRERGLNPKESLEALDYFEAKYLNESRMYSVPELLESAQAAPLEEAKLSKLSQILKPEVLAAGFVPPGYSVALQPDKATDAMRNGAREVGGIALATSWRSVPAGLDRREAADFKSKRKRAYAAFEAHLQSLGVSYQKVKGKWDEYDPTTGITTPVEEPSFLIYGITREQTLKLLTLLPGFEQDGVIYAGPETSGRIMLYLLDRETGGISREVLPPARFNRAAGNKTGLSPGRDFAFTDDDSVGATDVEAERARKNKRRRMGESKGECVDARYLIK